MKASGKVLRFEDGQNEVLWWASIKWTPDGTRVTERDNTYLETSFYSTEPAAQQAAEEYAKALGLEIEWEVTR